MRILGAVLLAVYLCSNPRAALAGDPTALLFPLDDSYELVNFTNSSAANEGNDDGSSASIPLPFTYNLYGDTYDSVFVNNNGNVSFTQPFSTFTASGFPSSQFKMVAAFWGDVDTRNNLGRVWQKITDTTMIVTWDNVGYFGVHGDKRNTFQLAISNGDDPEFGPGNNVCFSYDDMQWTTGDASSGSNGFGGTPATVGVNRGNNTDFFQLGRFDHAGTDYDGPEGSADGVSYLDSSRICFNTSTTTGNIDPLPSGFPISGRVEVNAGVAESLALTVNFSGPEARDLVTLTVNDIDNAGERGLMVNVTNGIAATAVLSWTPTCNDTGDYLLEFQAVDDFDPPGETFVPLLLSITCGENEAPSPIGFPEGDVFRVDAGLGESLDTTVQFASPEMSQTTSVTVNDLNQAVPSGLVVTNTDGQTATSRLQWTPTCANEGTYEVEFVATDSFGSVTRVLAQIVVGCSPSPTPSDTPTPTATPTETLSPTPSNTRTSTSTPTMSRTPTPTRSGTSTRTVTSTYTATPTRTDTRTVTETPSATGTRTATNTRTQTFTRTPTDTPTDTATPTRTRTGTRTWTPTHSATPASTSTATSTVTDTPVNTATRTTVPIEESPGVPKNDRGSGNGSCAVGSAARSGTISWVALAIPLALVALRRRR